MNSKNTVIQLVLGGIVFLFSVALGYFTSDYLQRIGTLEYDKTMLIFGGAYILIGIALLRVFPVSLGFLFSSDVFLLYVLGREYRGYENLSKVLITGIIILLLYLLAYWKLKDTDATPGASQ
jgi:hypothetical protein